MIKIGIWQKKRFWVRIAVMVLIATVFIPGTWFGLKLVMNTQTRLWLPNYTKDLLSFRYAHGNQTEHMFILLCDHWEPGRGTRAMTEARDWLSRFKPIARNHRDSIGRQFRYTWFYPIDGFEPDIISELAQAAFDGYGEIEVHWHHRHDSSPAFETEFVEALTGFTDKGALISSPEASPRFSFIHGNWALDNSRDPKYCGVSDEISILQRLGCYADMTFPSFAVLSQPSTINRIYYAQDTPQSKSYDKGVLAKVGSEGEGLLMIPGPIGINTFNPLLLFETAAIDDAEGSGFSGKVNKPDQFRDYFNPTRVGLWNNLGVGVDGRREWVFVKLHAHGMEHKEILLGGELDAMLFSVEKYCREKGITLHYIVAREAFNLVKAAERQLEGPPEAFYDLIIPPPLNTIQNMALDCQQGLENQLESRLSRPNQ